MTRTTTRRPLSFWLQVALAFALAAIVTVALWWGFVRERGPVPARGITVEATFTGLPDGPAPVKFDGGQPAIVQGTLGDTGAMPRIIDGRMTFQPTTDGSAAAYYSTPDLVAPVRTIGARFVFRPGNGTQGAIALVASRGVKDEVPPTINPVPVHFVLTPINWNVSLSREEGEPLQVIAAGDLPKPLVEDGQTVYEMQLTIDGSNLTLDLPNGVHQIVSDPRISEWQGSYATFELFSNHGQTDSIGAFDKIWASGAGSGG